MRKTEGTIGEQLGGAYVTIVALGDSITAVNHWTMGGLNWVGLLQANLGTCFPEGGTVINSGIGGDKLEQGLRRIERDALRFSPNLAIVSYGMNDAPGGAAEVARFKENLRDMTRSLRSAGSEVLLRTPNPVINMADGTEAFELTMGGERRRFDVAAVARAIAEVADGESTWLVDHYALWKRSLASPYHGEMCMLMGNSVHPNAFGHRRFYHELAPVLGAEPLFQNEWQHILERQADET